MWIGFWGDVIVGLRSIYLFAANIHQINKKQRMFEFRPTVRCLLRIFSCIDTSKYWYVSASI